MQHAEFRRLFGANPRRTEPDVLEHRHGCAECARYADDLEKIDRLVAGALDGVPVPAAPPPWEIEADMPSGAQTRRQLAALVRARRDGPADTVRRAHLDGDFARSRNVDRGHPQARRERARHLRGVVEARRESEDRSGPQEGGSRSSSRTCRCRSRASARCAATSRRTSSSRRAMAPCM